MLNSTVTKQKYSDTVSEVLLLNNLFTHWYRQEYIMRESLVYNSCSNCLTNFKVTFRVLSVHVNELFINCVMPPLANLHKLVKQLPQLLYAG